LAFSSVDDVQKVEAVVAAAVVVVIAAVVAAGLDDWVSVCSEVLDVD
jgi:hypothetical protein